MRVLGQHLNKEAAIAGVIEVGNDGNGVGAGGHEYILLPQDDGGIQLLPPQHDDIFNGDGRGGASTDDSSGDGSFLLEADGYGIGFEGGLDGDGRGNAHLPPLLYGSGVNGWMLAALNVSQ